MDPALFQPIYRFNTWANEHIRQGAEQAGDELLRQPLDLWFGSVFSILTHLCATEAIWLARLRDGESMPRTLTVADFASATDLIEYWRDLDNQWEAYAARFEPAMLDEEVAWTSALKETFSHPGYILALHVAFHNSEHRAHAGTGLTQLGVRHGPQDFLLQFMPAEAIARRGWPVRDRA